MGSPTDFITDFVALIALVWFLIFTMIVLSKLSAVVEMLDYIKKKINA